MVDDTVLYWLQGMRLSWGMSLKACYISIYDWVGLVMDVSHFLRVPLTIVMQLLQSWVKYQYT